MAAVAAKVQGHFARLGGVLLHPRATFDRMLMQQEGSLWEILLWVMLIAAAISPVRVGRALLVARMDFLAGLQSFLGVLSNRMTQALLGLLVAAVVLHLIDRFRREEEARIVRFDQALDLCAFLLVPYLMLTALGSLLSQLGAEFWFMPHRAISGNALVVTIRCLVAFSWSLVLFGLVAYRVWKGDVQPAELDRS